MESVEVVSTDKHIDGEVLIRRPVAEVFAFYSDFRNLPQFLGDVMEVQVLSPTRSRWTIEGPLGIRGHWSVTVTEMVTGQIIRYRVGDSSHTSASWEVRFASTSDPEETRVTEILIAPLGKLELEMMALIGKYPQEEVRANLHRLQQLLETGMITDTSYAVKNKFASGTYRPGISR